MKRLAQALMFFMCINAYACETWVNGICIDDVIIQTQETDCSSYVDEGWICWDTDDDLLYSGDGTNAIIVGSGADATFTSVEVTAANTPGSVIFVDSNGQLDEDNSNFYWDDASDRLGIGTTSPLEALHVQRPSQGVAGVFGAKTTGNNQIASIAFMVDPANTYYKAGIGLSRQGGSGIGDMVFAVDSNADAAVVSMASDEKMRITQEGNVGINDTDPDAMLEIVADATTEECLHLKAAASQSADIATWTDSSDTILGVIDQQGWIGVGTDTPAYNVHVYSTGNDYPTLTAQSTQAAYGASFITIASGNQQSAFNTYGASYPASHFGTSSANYSLLYHSNGDGFKIGTLQADPVIFGTNNAERVRITGAGLVGLNDTAPDAMLEIAASATTEECLHLKAAASQSADIFRVTKSDDTDYVVVDNVGNVGIGADPARKLHVSGTSCIARIEDTSSGGYAELELYASNGIAALYALGDSYSTSGGFIADSAVWDANNLSGGISFIDRAGGGMRFYLGGYADSDEKMRISSSGNVGIGALDPEKTLHVAGTLTATDATFETVNNAQIGDTVAADATFTDITVTGSINGTIGSSSAGDATFTALNVTPGKIGIGTTHPTYTLDIVNSDATLQIYNTDNGESGDLYLGSRQAGGTPKYFTIRQTADDATNGAMHFIPNSLDTTNAVITFQSDGNVGIGLTNPVQELAVNGDIHLGAGNAIYGRGGTDANWRMGNSIGAVSASLVTDNKWEITASSNADEGIVFGVNGGNSILELLGSDQSAYFRGNVGIGVTDPDKLLEVDGDMSAYDATFTAVHTTVGNMGIGTTTPGATLEVDGNIIATDATMSTVKMDRCRLDQETQDPADLQDGDMWYRSDTDEVRVRINGTTYVLQVASP